MVVTISAIKALSIFPPWVMSSYARLRIAVNGEGMGINLVCGDIYIYIYMCVCVCVVNLHTLGASSIHGC